MTKAADVKEMSSADMANAGFPGDPNYNADDWLGSDYEAAYEDSGQQIDFNALPDGKFYGLYLGLEVKKDVQGLDGNLHDVNLLKFADRNGERFCVFGNYAIEQAVQSGKLVEGKKVMLVHHGKIEINGGQQSMNRIDVYVGK